MTPSAGPAPARPWQHRWDPFLDRDAADPGAEKQAELDGALLDDSPYPEVPPTDNPDMPVDTLRAWAIGAVLGTVVAACNILLVTHRNGVIIPPTVVQLAAYPVGCFMARVLPDTSVSLLGARIRLNPGPFSVKEHTIITVMAAACASPSYSLEVVLAQRLFYRQAYGWAFQLLLVLSMQATGLGIAGVARRFLVWPASMIWPANLVTTAVMHSLHHHGDAGPPGGANDWRIGRFRFFLVVALAAFAYRWVPQVLAQFLQLFTLACFVAPRSVLVNQLFGAISGLGLLPVSFDWTIVSAFVGSPLQTPAFAIVNVLAGLLVMAVGAACLAWGGSEYYRYLPISANGGFDRFARPYNVTRIMSLEHTLDERAYRGYSPMLLSSTLTLTYCLSFAAMTSTVAHVALFYGPDLWRRARDASGAAAADVHLRLMRRHYRECPDAWFLAVFVVSLACGLAAALAWPTHLPWWAYVVCIAMSAFFFVPIGVVQAITNLQPGLNVLSEMVVGYMLPGRPVTMMLFKSWATSVSAYGLTYVADIKVGHYLKIPPRSLFAAQTFAVVWLSVVQVATLNFLMGHMDRLCHPDQPQGLTCLHAITFSNVSVIWGVIGPRRVFGAGAIYSWTNWFWLIGIACPLLQYALAHLYPRSVLRYVVFPVVFYGPTFIPPGTLYNFFQWVIVGLVFNWAIRRRFLAWWTQYNFVLSGALDIGSRICVVIAALALGLTNAQVPDWWGNRAPFDTLDFNGTAVTKKFVPGVTEPLGPGTW